LETGGAVTDSPDLEVPDSATFRFLKDIGSRQVCRRSRVRKAELDKQAARGTTRLSKIFGTTSDHIKLTLSPPGAPLTTIILIRSLQGNASIMSENILFDHAFRIETINSSKYDRVSRIEAYSNSDAREVRLILDVNTELWPLAEGDQLQMSLALSLNLDGSKDDGKGWREVGRGEQTLADEYDYVCHGKIYRFEEGTGDNM
jgi:DNA-directed RNA polymerases I, II, and III subunit RPABC3